MKKLLYVSGLFVMVQAAMGQNCSVTTTTSQQVVCAGDQVTITGQATASLPANQFFNFNQNALPLGWGTTGGTNYNANICGSSPDGTPYFWASTASGLPQIITADFDICSGGNLEFQMKYSVQGGSTPCEGPDLAHEGVSMEYSLNSGATWVEFRYYRPDGVVLAANPMTSGSVATGQTSLTSWATYTVPIPAAAISGSTRFRWIQKVSSGTCCDNWGLDNIGVLAGPCLTTNLEWSNGLSGVGSFTFTPTADTCFTASLYDDNNNFLCMSSPVCVTMAYPFNTNTTATICYGETYNVGSNSFSTSGVHTATVPTVMGCDSTVTLNLTVKPQITHAFSHTLCNGETYSLGTQTLGSTGNYQEIFTAVDGCDSTVSLNLTVFPVYAATKDTSFCDGYVYHFGGQDFTQGGSFPINFQSINGCDSIVTLNINLLPAPVPSAGPDLVLCSDEVGFLGGVPINNAVYSWTGNGLSDNTASLTEVTMHSLTPQSLTYVVSSDYFGCVASDTVLVGIVPYPVVDVPPVLAQCLQGNNFNFTAGNNFLPSAVFNWSVPQCNNPNPGDQSPTGIHFNQPGTHQVNVTVHHGACSTTDMVEVIVHPEPVASLNPLPPNGCIPHQVAFENTSTPSTVSSQWAFGNGSFSNAFTPQNTYENPGTYDVSLVVTTPEGCIDTAIYIGLITAWPLPLAGFSVSPTLIYQDDPYAQVTDNSTSAEAWSYTVSSGGYYATSEFGHQFYDTGYHYIHQVVTNQYGCTTEAEHMVQVLPATTLWFPNAFTPNGQDELNGTFFGIGNEVRNYSLTIFDRWGMKVFSSFDINQGWDGNINGKPIKSDVYVYKATYVDHRGDKQERHGHVMLMR